MMITSPDNLGLTALGTSTSSRLPESTGFELVCCRLEDFFGHGVPWHRALWGIGTILALQEVLEYAEGCLRGRFPGTEGLQFVIKSAAYEVKRDPGVAHLAEELENTVKQLDVKSADRLM